MPRTVVMGDPTHFSVRGGANPHTRNVLGLKKRVDAARARIQWHNFARTLISYGSEVCVIAPHPKLTGLVYPANAGFLYRLQQPRSTPRSGAVFYLANLLPTRASEREIYRPFLRAMGYETRDIAARFEGEADFFPAGRYMIFTFGKVERQRFVLRLGIPPWKRIYGLRSEIGALTELRQIAGEQPILAIELCLEAHYHGDTVLCSFGPAREFLLAYLEGVTAPSRERLTQAFGEKLIALSERDAAFYAANSFQIDRDGKFYLFMPEGVSDELLAGVRARGVEPVTVDVSEFLAKGGGSVKCMILDLGPRDQQPGDPAAAKFREERSYQRLYGENAATS